MNTSLTSCNLHLKADSTRFEQTKDYVKHTDSYRPIALALTLSKMFQWCILIDHAELSIYHISSLQFGFKLGLSTHLCTGRIKNAVIHYSINDSPTYGCFLDASKAFDRVNHSETP